VDLLTGAPKRGFLRLPEGLFPFDQKVEIFINCADPDSMRILVDSPLMNSGDPALIPALLRYLADVLGDQASGPAFVEQGTMTPLRTNA
jgi:hypothetical protein